MSRFASVWRVAALVVLTASVSMSARPAEAAQAGRIDTISPAAARPGEQVTITGVGFGARNVRITVGDVPARVVTATGHTASFLVPEGVSIGRTRVTATNPGGHTGSIAFEVLLGLTVDVRSTVQGVVGPDGGSLLTQSGGVGYALTIPAGAIAADVTITLTAVTSLTNLPFSGGVLAAAQFEPSGLVLQLPAHLTIVLPTAVDPRGLLGFLVDNRGTSLEVRPVTTEASSLTLEVRHFTVGGAATGTLADFERQVVPLLNAISGTNSPTQAMNLITLVAAWTSPRSFGFQVCTLTQLCAQVFDIATQSLLGSVQQACGQAALSIQQGNPFRARLALEIVMQAVARLVELGDAAEQAMVPGFDLQMDLSCVETTVPQIADLAESQAIANPRKGLLALLVELADDAGLMDMVNVQVHVQRSLLKVLNAILSEAIQTCPIDPVAGERLIDFVLDSIPDLYLDGLDPGLADRFHVARAGCRVRISPPQATVDLGKQVQFTGMVVGLSPSSVSWSLQVPTRGSTIDANGLFTAGQTAGPVIVRATSVADSSVFGTASVTVKQSADMSVTIKTGTAIVRFGGGVDGTGISWTEYDANEDAICCIPIVLPADQPPPVSVGGSSRSLNVTKPSPNVLAADFSGSTAQDSHGAFTVRAELVFATAGTLQIAINPAWLQSANEIVAWALDSGESASCERDNAVVRCTPGGSTTIPISQAGTRIVDIGAAIPSRSSASGRAVTITFTPQ